MILTAIISVTVIGAVCGAMLAVAAKVMEVKTDERIPAIRACLPGANCGACGFTGCDGYAKALAEDPSVKTNLCIPGADTVSRALSDVMGVGYEDVVEQIAAIHCRGDCSVTGEKMDYRGLESCAAANLFFGGNGKCTFGCIGLGDCAKVCPNNAICIENGIAHIDSRCCSGCGLCAKTCPKHLITLMPDVEKMLVTCSNTDKGAATRRVCTHGCIGCKKCERECPQGAVTVVNNLAVIDYDKCTDCGHCVEVCTTGCIMVADFSGIHR